MKVLTTAEMREVDRRTIEMGIPGIVLMENAAHRVVELMAERCAPLAGSASWCSAARGTTAATGWRSRGSCSLDSIRAALAVVLWAAPEDLHGDAAANLKMLEVCGCPVLREIPAAARNATLVVDAVLGDGRHGAASGRMLEAIREINNGFPLAKVVAVDIPSGLAGDSGKPAGEFARADFTVTFTAPKLAQRSRRIATAWARW